MAKIMREHRISVSQMDAILDCLHTFNFDLKCLAPSVYYLEKIENAVLPTTVMFFNICDIL